MTDKPQAVAWFMDAPIADDDPLAAVKRRALAHDAAAEVLGQAECVGHMDARADHLAPMSDLIGDTAFSAEEVKEIMARSGLSGDDLDAAANVAWALHQIEHGIE